jgi:two-component system chemotaxis sensor kinase CheA
MVGQGSRFTLLLPASMVVKGALLFEQNEETFAIPLSYTESVVSMQKDDIHIVGKGLIATHLGRSMSVVFLKDIFDKKHLNEIKREKALQQTFKNWNKEDKLFIVVVSYGGKLVGLVIDKLLQQKEIVERPLKKPLDDTPFMSGATIMGNGKVCLVVDVPALVNFLFKSLVSGTTN